MTHGAFQTPPPINEPVRAYAPGSAEKASLKAELARQSAEKVDVPLIVGGEELRTGNTLTLVAPHDKGRSLGVAHKAGAAEVQRAIEAASRAKPAWAALPWEQRAAVFLRAGELLAGPWRDRAQRRDDARASRRPRTRPRSTRPASRSTSCASTRTSPSASTPSSPSRPRASGTGSSTGRSTASSSPSRPSTSPRSPPTCRPRRRCSATRWSGSRPRPRSSRTTG